VHAQIAIDNRDEVGERSAGVDADDNRRAPRRAL